jgi:hypothetical protein
MSAIQGKVKPGVRWRWCWERLSWRVELVGAVPVWIPGECVRLMATERYAYPPAELDDFVLGFLK